MEAYRVLFVEKAPAESSMRTLLDWGALGFDLMGTVATEAQALAMIAESARTSSSLSWRWPRVLAWL